MAWPALAFRDPGEARPPVLRAYRTLIWDGIFAQGMTSLTTGAFFTSFVVALGASNSVVGVLNAAAPLAQVLQWPALPWVLRARSWRRLTAVSAAVGRSAWFVAALLPWFAPEAWRLPLLLGIISVHHVSNGVACCAFNSWMRALIPPETAGRFFGHRTAWATAAGVLVGVVAGFAVQAAEGGGHTLTAYAASIAVGACSGWIGLWFLVRTPEAAPELAEMVELEGAVAPARDVRPLFVFLGLWALALNLVQPFVTVYLLKYLQLGVGWTMALTMAGQALNVALFPAWGRLADHYSNRAVLRLACGVSVLSFLLWPVAAHVQPAGVQVLLATVALLVGGAAQACTLLCCYLLTLKSAPKESPATVIAKGNGIAGIGALVACAAGGVLADGLEGTGLPQAAHLFGLDVVFLLAAGLGACAVAWLARVEEHGTGRGRDVLRALFRGEV